MEADEKSIDLFTTRVRQMILQYNELSEQNAVLNATVNEQKNHIGRLDAQIVQLRNDYNRLKMARMLEITDGDMAMVQKRIAKLIRDVDKCITLLSADN